MKLSEFFSQTQAEVKVEIADRLGVSGDGYPYPESIFAEIVMQHMSDIGMTFDPQICHFTAKVGNANLRLSGYSVSDDGDQLDLFVSLYAGGDTVTSIPDSETKTAAEQCLRFLKNCATGRLASRIDESNDAYPLAVTIQDCYKNLDQIRVYVVTDRQAKAKNFKPREINGKLVKLEIMDIERLHRHWSEGKPRDEIVMNFEEVCGGPLPCIWVPGQVVDYDYAMTVIPGEALRFAYEKFGNRLLEANVRSFLSATGKVNKGIRDTLQHHPDRFMAYNNGIVLVVDELHLGRASDGSPGILWIKGMQIVNGGQTTASIYFTKRKNLAIDLREVRVPAKIIVLRAQDPQAEESMISDISKFANSQTTVKLSDLSANKPFHVEIEKLSISTFCPDGESRWFYERATGSYKTLLAREGTTPARLRHLKKAIPSTRKIIKTDLIKFLHAWDQKPDLVSLGAQKNFEKFMNGLAEQEANSPVSLPDVSAYKRMIAKAILFKTTQRLVHPLVSAFRANVTAYVVSLLANRFGGKMDLERIWIQQELSDQLKEQITTWVPEVNRILHKSAGDRMISEWAKKPECWETVRKVQYPSPIQGIPEVRS